MDSKVAAVYMMVECDKVEEAIRGDSVFRGCSRLFDWFTENDDRPKISDVKDWIRELVNGENDE